MRADAYSRALGICGEAIKHACVLIQGLDVGGGFPGYYRNVTVPPLGDHFDAIATGVRALNLPDTVVPHCEPGRALVADGLSLITQAKARREHTIFINDGIYGSLKTATAFFPIPSSKSTRPGALDSIR